MSELDNRDQQPPPGPISPDTMDFLQSIGTPGKDAISDLNRVAAERASYGASSSQADLSHLNRTAAERVSYEASPSLADLGSGWDAASVGPTMSSGGSWPGGQMLATANSWSTTPMGAASSIDSWGPNSMPAAYPPISTSSFNMPAVYPPHPTPSFNMPASPSFGFAQPAGFGVAAPLQSSPVPYSRSVYQYPAGLVSPGMPRGLFAPSVAKLNTSTLEPTNIYSTMFGDALASWRPGMPVANAFIPPNQPPSLGSSSFTASSFTKLFSEGAVEPENGGINKFSPAVGQGQNNNDKDSQLPGLSAWFAVPHPKETPHDHPGHSSWSLPFIVPSQESMSKGPVAAETSKGPAAAETSKGPAAAETSKGPAAAETSKGPATAGRSRSKGPAASRKPKGKGPAATGTSKGKGPAATGTSKGKGPAAAGTSKQPGGPSSDGRMAISPTDVLGKEAVNNALKYFSREVDKTIRRHESQRATVLIPTMIQILKDWVTGCLVSRIMGGSFPTHEEVVQNCRLMSDTPEVTLLFSISNLSPVMGPNKSMESWQKLFPKDAVTFFQARVIDPTEAQVVLWRSETLRAALHYTICQILPNPRLFPDLAYTDPFDITCGLRTLVLGQTGAYMHYFGNRSERPTVTSFHGIIARDSMQHPCSMDAYIMAHDIQIRVIGFVAHPLIHSNYAAVKKFLAGQNIIVNHQLQLWGEKPGSFFLMVPFCVSVLTLALAGVEEFGLQVSVDKIVHSPQLMALLPCKVSFVRSFLFLIRTRGTDAEKSNISWLDTCVKSRVEMSITPYHQGNIAELGAVVQPKWSKLFPFDFANLESKSDFDRTYKAYEDTGEMRGEFQECWNHVEAVNSARLRACKAAQKVFDLSNRFVQGLIELESCAFENAGGGDGEPRQAATTSLYPMLQASGSTVAHHMPPTDTGSPMDESSEEQEEEEEQGHANTAY